MPFLLSIAKCRRASIKHIFTHGKSHGKKLDDAFRILGHQTYQTSSLKLVLEALIISLSLLLTLTSFEYIKKYLLIINKTYMEISIYFTNILLIISNYIAPIDRRKNP